MWLAMLPQGHRQLVTLQNPKGDVLAERLLSANADSITIQMDAKEGKPPEVVATSFADFFVMGVKHIWTGYDHLLFLFGLLIVTRNFAASVKIITCFTIAHSITLAVATLSLIQISSRIVEPLIAASIVYVGTENLFRGDDPKGRWLLTFGFGLIHGFGFASVLKELGVGANGSGITVPLVSFNLGVEVGQIAIAALVLPVIWKLRARPVFVRRWVPACSVLVALLGGYWFVQRVWF
jgi:hydrogenase/urease accessory protein HupE